VILGQPLGLGIMLGFTALLVAGCGRTAAPAIRAAATELQGRYESIGQGMGATLTLTNEKLGYTLSDRGTYVARQPELELVVLVEGDPLLHNPYGVMAVNPEKHPSVNFRLAQEFISYLTSYDTQLMIAEYRPGGQALFHPHSEEWQAGRSGYRLPETPPGGGQRLVLATTTSTADSGLLGRILPPFERAYNAQVLVIAVGTGQALALGRNGDADVILVHARSQEDEFVAQGYGVNRQSVMYNDFVVLGPEDDPAGIAGMTDAAAAFGMIARAGVTFVSRGDSSGTHVREMAIWQQAGIEPLPQEQRFAEGGG
jgi:ABC-type tungstate transport system permease subunit